MLLVVLVVVRQTAADGTTGSNPCVQMYPYKPDVRNNIIAIRNVPGKAKPLFAGNAHAQKAIDRLSASKSLELPRLESLSCCLVPTDDIRAHVFVNQQAAIRAIGWRLLTVAPRDIHLLGWLGDKRRLNTYAARLGLLHLLPAQWTSPAEARYPCVFKMLGFAAGEGLHIVYSASEVTRRIREAGAHAEGFVLQELAVGHEEVSTSLVVVHGEIKHAIRTQYTYHDPKRPAQPFYLWPKLVETVEARQITETLPPFERRQIQAFLQNVTGICNANYKVAPAAPGEPPSRIILFEFNMRLGGDVAGGTSVQGARRANPGYWQAFLAMQDRFAATADRYCV